MTTYLTENEILFGLEENVVYNFWGADCVFLGYELTKKGLKGRIGNRVNQTATSVLIDLGTLTKTNIKADASLGPNGHCKISKLPAP
jgi:hypothetical protein